MAVLKSVYGILSSLRLTVWLLGFSVILIFFGTLDQVNFGIYETQKRYFQSLIAFWQYPENEVGGSFLKYLVLPIPGGYTLGFLLLLNLALAHFRYFRPRWRALGIVIIHLGLALLLIGQFVTDLLQKDYQMWITEGGHTNYGESFRENELVIVSKSDPNKDKVWSIAESALKKGKVFEIAGLPFSVVVREYYQNARIVRLNPEQNSGLVSVTDGVGTKMRLGLFPAAPTYRHDERNIATAIIEIKSQNENSSSWIVSNVFEGQLPSQTFEMNGETFLISMRYKRKYFPFFMHLEDFTHDRYEGTDIPKNFSSKVRLEYDDGSKSRETLIYMNHPLRHEGHTFYQASFSKDDRSSMLQVVRNPGWLIPYVSCLMVSLGLIYQFGWSLFSFSRRMAK